MRTKFMIVALTLVVLLGASSAPAAQKLRVMAANLSSGNRQSYDPGEGIRIFQGLKPDLVLIQEFNYKSNSDKDLGEFVEKAFGKGFSFYRENESTDSIPNGIISRHPIIASGEWEDTTLPDRDFAWARIDIPGSIDLWVVSLHLSNKSSEKRVAAAKKLVEQLKKIPAADYVILGGDLNARSRGEEAIRVLSAVVSESAPPVDNRGDAATNMSRSKHYDWLLADAELRPLMVPVKVRAPGSTSDTPATVRSFPNGLVFDSSRFEPLSWVAPIRASDSTAPGMQHFAVIKDFLIPTGGRR